MPGLKEKIRALLDNQFYVRLLRTEDNSTVQIALPWSPSSSQEGADYRPETLERGGDTSTPRKGDGGGIGSPREAPMSVKAYAGPMSPSQADKFRRLWVASPRTAPRESVTKYKQVCVENILFIESSN